MIPLTDTKLVCTCRLRVEPDALWRLRYRPLLTAPKPFSRATSRSHFCPVDQERVALGSCYVRAYDDTQKRPKCFGCPLAAKAQRENTRTYNQSNPHGFDIPHDLSKACEQSDGELWTSTYALNGKACWLRVSGRKEVIPYMEGLDRGFVANEKGPSAFFYKEGFIGFITPTSDTRWVVRRDTDPFLAHRQEQPKPIEVEEAFDMVVLPAKKKAKRKQKR